VGAVLCASSCGRRARLAARDELWPAASSVQSCSKWRPTDTGGLAEGGRQLPLVWNLIFCIIIGRRACSQAAKERAKVKYERSRGEQSRLGLANCSSCLVLQFCSSAVRRDLRGGLGQMKSTGILTRRPARSSFFSHFLLSQSLGSATRLLPLASRPRQCNTTGSHEQLSTRSNALRRAMQQASSPKERPADDKRPRRPLFLAFLHLICNKHNGRPISTIFPLCPRQLSIFQRRPIWTLLASVQLCPLCSLGAVWLEAHVPSAVAALQPKTVPKDDPFD